MLVPKSEHVISPPTFACGFCGHPPSACACNKHDQPERSKQPQTLSYVFADFGEPTRFSMFIRDFWAYNGRNAAVQNGSEPENDAQGLNIGGPSVL